MIHSKSFKHVKKALLNSAKHSKNSPFNSFDQELISNKTSQANLEKLANEIVEGCLEELEKNEPDEMIYNLKDHTNYNIEAGKTDLPWTDIARTHQKAQAFGITMRNRIRPTMKKKQSISPSDIDNQDPARYYYRRALKHKCKKLSHKRALYHFLADQDKCKSHFHINTYTDNIQRHSEVRTETDDWIYLGMVIDRLLFYVFSVGIFIGYFWMFYEYFGYDWFD